MRTTGLAGLLLEAARLRRRQRSFVPVFDLLFEGEGGGGAGGGTGSGDGKDPVKEAQYARDQALAQVDKLSKQIADLSKKVLTPEREKQIAELEAARDKAEEERKKKEGDFEAWRKDITGKHADEVKKATEQLTALQKEIADDKIAAAFGAATDYFGAGETSKTILTPTLAFKTLREYVSYEEYDFGADDGGKKKTIVVRDASGKIIRGNGGHPAPFAEAMGRLIETLPDKDHILRGSGKAGSGARGGSGNRDGAIDYRNLTPEQMRDPKIREEAKRRTAAAGGIVQGEAWERAAAARK